MLLWKLRVKKCPAKERKPKENERKEGENKRIYSQKTWLDQTHAMVGKSTQPEKMINRARTKNRVRVVVQCRERVPRRRYRVPEMASE